MVIAIDGPAGAGKSTVSRAVAEALGYRYLDTGAMYRALTLAALRAGVDSANADGLAALADLAVTMTGDRELRTPEVERNVSLVAAHPQVRAALHRAQRAFLEQGDAVGEGRDVGGAVWPGAELKIWLDAAPLCARVAAWRNWETRRRQLRWPSATSATRRRRSTRPMPW